MSTKPGRTLVICFTVFANRSIFYLIVFSTCIFLQSYFVTERIILAVFVSIARMIKRNQCLITRKFCAWFYRIDALSINTKITGAMFIFGTICSILSVFDIVGQATPPIVAIFRFTLVITIEVGSCHGECQQCGRIYNGSRDCCSYSNLLFRSLAAPRIA